MLNILFQEQKFEPKSKTISHDTKQQKVAMSKKTETRQSTKQEIDKGKQEDDKTLEAAVDTTNEPDKIKLEGPAVNTPETVKSEMKTPKKAEVTQRAEPEVKAPKAAKPEVTAAKKAEKAEETLEKAEPEEKTPKLAEQEVKAPEMVPIVPEPNQTASKSKKVVVSVKAEEAADMETKMADEAKKAILARQVEKIVPKLVEKVEPKKEKSPEANVQKKISEKTEYQDDILPQKIVNKKSPMAVKETELEILTQSSPAAKKVSPKPMEPTSEADQGKTEIATTQVHKPAKVELQVSDASPDDKPVKVIKKTAKPSPVGELKQAEKPVQVEDPLPVVQPAQVVKPSKVDEPTPIVESPPVVQPAPVLKPETTAAAVLKPVKLEESKIGETAQPSQPIIKPEDSRPAAKTGLKTIQKAEIVQPKPTKKDEPIQSEPTVLEKPFSILKKPKEPSPPEERVDEFSPEIELPTEQEDLVFESPSSPREMSPTPSDETDAGLLKKKKKKKKKEKVSPSKVDEGDVEDEIAEKEDNSPMTTTMTTTMTTMMLDEEREPESEMSRPEAEEVMTVQQDKQRDEGELTLEIKTPTTFSRKQKVSDARREVAAASVVKNAVKKPVKAKTEEPDRGREQQEAQTVLPVDSKSSRKKGIVPDSLKDQQQAISHTKSHDTDNNTTVTTAQVKNCCMVGDVNMHAIVNTV